MLAGNAFAVPDSNVQHSRRQVRIAVLLVLTQLHLNLVDVELEEFAHLLHRSRCTAFRCIHLLQSSGS
jgi:hypothetical protein